MAGDGRVGLVFDDRMCSHANPWDSSHPETPHRIRAIANRLRSAGVFQRCIRVEAREATDDELETVHTKNHITLMRRVSSKAYGKEGRMALARRFNSIYFNEGSSESALLAAGSVVELSIQVARGKLCAGAAIVRPPGHHAEADAAMGFCLFNNVSIAAHVLVHDKPELGIGRVLIVDWDVHHGNGTQHMFWNDPQVLYFSVHRYDDGTFYPIGNEGNYDKVGQGKGAGFNINVPWPHGGFGDADYFAVWDHVLLPIAEEFNPDIVLISGGFDSAKGDPLGGCRLTPYGYSQMTLKLMGLGKRRVVLVLEGGYNLDSIADSYLSCVKTLLGDPLNSDSLLQKPFEGTWSLIHKVRDELEKFWPVLGKCSDFFQEEMHKATSTSIEESLASMNVNEETSDEDFLNDNTGTFLEAEDYRTPTEVDIAAEDQETHSECGKIDLLEKLIVQMGELTTAVKNEPETVQNGREKQLDEFQITEVSTSALKSGDECLGYVVDEAADNGKNILVESIPKPMLLSVDENSPICPRSNGGNNMYIWYASYGSNMWKPRFMCYLEGGQVEGMARKCSGSRNRAPPSDTAWMQVEHKLYFGFSYTSMWGHGGVAFLELRPTASVSTHTHLYKITVEQFNDLFMQENLIQAQGSDLINAEFVHSFSKQSSGSNSIVLCEDKWYGTVLYLGEKDGFPILTFTCSESHEEKFKAGLLPVSPPSEAYRWTVARSLVEDLGLSKAAALSYVFSKGGKK